MPTITIKNSMTAQVLSAQSGGGSQYVSVNDAVMFNIEFSGSHTYHRSFAELDPKQSIVFDRDGKAPPSATMSLTVQAAFQPTLTKTGVAVNMTNDLTIEALYFLPDPNAPITAYGLKIGEQPPINIGLAAQVDFLKS